MSAAEGAEEELDLNLATQELIAKGKEDAMSAS